MSCIVSRGIRYEYTKSQSSSGNAMCIASTILRPSFCARSMIARSSSLETINAAQSALYLELRTCLWFVILSSLLGAFRTVPPPVAQDLRHCSAEISTDQRGLRNNFGVAFLVFFSCYRFSMTECSVSGNSGGRQAEESPCASTSGTQTLFLINEESLHA